MLLDQETLSGIKKGRISLAFRKWRRPTVKSGGTLLTAIGQLSIESVKRTDGSAISEADAKLAGFPDLKALLAELQTRPEGDLYKIRLRLMGPDPRIALRETIPDQEDLADLLVRLERMDARSPSGPWTRRTLQVIARRPQVPAGDLATDVGMERALFKTRVRRLKGLGLTQSLEIGYRLSPRGNAVLGQLSDS